MGVPLLLVAHRVHRDSHLTDCVYAIVPMQVCLVMFVCSFPRPVRAETSSSAALTHTSHSQMATNMLAIIVGSVIGGILLIVIAVELYIIYELLRARKFKQKLMSEME